MGRTRSAQIGRFTTDALVATSSPRRGYDRAVAARLKTRSAQLVDLGTDQHQWKSDPLPQWQYCAINHCDLPRGADEIDLLNGAGEEGWELVGITANHVAYLKRQIAPPVAQSARPPTERA
jgi:hypothetical protein